MFKLGDVCWSNMYMLSVEVQNFFDKYCKYNRWEVQMMLTNEIPLGVDNERLDRWKTIECLENTKSQ